MYILVLRTSEGELIRGRPDCYIQCILESVNLCVLLCPAQKESGLPA